jgi:hypothetical protein
VRSEWRHHVAIAVQALAAAFATHDLLMASAAPAASATRLRDGSCEDGVHGRAERGGHDAPPGAVPPHFRRAPSLSPGLCP